jgi:hypothetical protein
MPESADPDMYQEWWGDREERDGGRQHAAGDGADAPSPKFQFVPAHTVLTLPPVQFVVEDILTASGSSMTAGAAGHAKSLLAIDLGFSIAADLPWAGRAVQQGSVAYIAAEGWAGFAQRIRAWLDYHNLAADLDLPVHFLPAAPQFLDGGDVLELLVALDTLPTPLRLVVIDTLSRTMAGGDENSSKDMSRYWAVVDRIQRATGAHTMTLHHTGWGGERERGHTSARGAADTVALIVRDDNAITLSCLKQKDAEAFPDLHFQLQPWAGSVVLAPVAAEDRNRRPLVLPDTRRKALDALIRASEQDGLSFTKWCETSTLSRATFSRAVNDLVAWSLIEKRKGKYVPV